MMNRKRRCPAWLPIFAIAAAAGISTPVVQAQTTLPVKIYAQELVDRAVAQHPDLRTITIYATPPKTRDSVVLASNVGRIGQPADAADAAVAASGKTRVVAGAGKNIEVELPLRDIAGQTVGTLDLAWRAAAHANSADFEKKAAAIRDAMARHIINVANLLDSYPYVASVTTRSRAQTLIDEAVRRHPDVTVLALRLKVPPKNELVVVGSTFGRHGKTADGDDLKVLDAPAPITGLYSNDKRFGVDLPVKDRSGVAIGTMNIGYDYSGKEDKKALEVKAVAVRDEIQARLAAIPAPEEIDP